MYARAFLGTVLGNMAGDIAGVSDVTQFVLACFCSAAAVLAWKDAR